MSGLPSSSTFTRLFRTLGAKTVQSDAYLVWSVEHRAWWRPSRHGYTPRLSEAGRFSRHDAVAICANAIPGQAARRGFLQELPVRLEDIETMRDAYRAEFPSEATEPWE